MSIGAAQRWGAPVAPTRAGIGRLQPIEGAGATLGPGFWADRLRINRERSIPHGFEQLRAAGNLHNLRLAAGEKGRYEALGLMFDQPFPFLDSDVYKWLEAAGWELAREQAGSLAAAADEAIGLVQRAQRPDGYLNSFVQVLGGGRPYTDLAWGHELYTFGHLIQAAIAWQRALRDGRLLGVALAVADSIERELRPNGREAIDGHPGVEMALVELYRTTGERRLLDLAATFVDRRGHGLLGGGRFGSTYWQDRLSVRDAPTVAGHAVRQLYLDCGAVDVAVELGDEQLLDAVRRRWSDMVATRTYLTGGLGSRYQGESFGDPYELPPDLAYAETCASVASVMLAWRLLLATGDPACADVIERTLYNGVLPGVSLDGTRFFYVNTLQRRTRRVDSDPGTGERQAWFPCACCPPNLMRLIASWPAYLATVDAAGVQIHQYAAGDIAAPIDGGVVRVRVETAYPWSGQVRVAVLETVSRPWTLTLRVPAWAGSAIVALPGEDGRRRVDRPIATERTWTVGDEVAVDFGSEPRLTDPHPRVDAVRGCVALERGPLVYCVETADLPSGVELDGVSISLDAHPELRDRGDLGAGLIGLDLPLSGSKATAIPYFAWANRSVEAMRVWIPCRNPASAPAR